MNCANDANQLQLDLDAIYRWSVSNNLPFNYKKCTIMSLRNRHEFSYRLGSDTLNRTTTERDLGVLTQSNMHCSAHCATAAAKANRQLGLLKRCFGTFEPSIFKIRLSIYIRPKLEYAVQVWSPWLKKDQTLLELPQRRATKCVRGMSQTPYPARL